MTVIIWRQLNCEGDIFTRACTASNLHTCVFVCISNVCVCVCVQVQCHCWPFSTFQDTWPRTAATLFLWVAGFWGVVWLWGNNIVCADKHDIVHSIIFMHVVHILILTHSFTCTHAHTHIHKYIHTLCSYKRIWRRRSLSIKRAKRKEERRYSERSNKSS